MLILDTNVLSELMRPEPNEKVVSWVANQPVRSLYTTAISQSEVYHGILSLPTGSRRTALRDAANSMFREDFSGRILSFTSDSAMPYAQIVLERRKRGRPVSQFDAQIAAIALCTGATVVTRNIPDFELCGVELENPWE